MNFPNLRVPEPRVLKELSKLVFLPVTCVAYVQMTGPRIGFDGMFQFGSSTFGALDVPIAGMLTIIVLKCVWCLVLSAVAILLIFELSHKLYGEVVRYIFAVMLIAFGLLNALGGVDLGRYAMPIAVHLASFAWGFVLLSMDDQPETKPSGVPAT